MLKILTKTNPQQISVYTQAQKDGRSIQHLSLFCGRAYLLLWPHLYWLPTSINQ